MTFGTKMCEKHISTSPSAIQVKYQRKAISTDEKLDIISCLEKGEYLVDIWHNVRFVHVSICTIYDNAGRITESAKFGTKI